MRRVAVVTGTRAEYGLLRSLMESVSTHPRLSLQLAVTGIHLLRKFGHTVDEIIQDGWRVDARIKMQRGDDGSLDQADGLSRGVRGIAAFLERAKSDIVVVLGDRIEAMAGALAGATTGRLVAHIHGGDLAPGDFDDSFRHAITKLAHLHLAATDAARRRIIRMGEGRDRVHVVGAPGLDRLIQLLAGKRVRNPKSSQALVIQHATGRTAERERRTMAAILRSVREAGLHPTVLCPNSDRGHRGILDAIDVCRKREGDGRFRFVRSLPRDDYLKLLIGADVLIGNSSSGIIEAATAGTPAVNIGRRQDGRQRSGRSVIETAETLTSIRTALAHALRKHPITGAPTVYGDGRAGGRIARLLAAVPLCERFRHKLNAY
ncbi:MAG: UDP-N-acetylglucosamine 2-epimerase (hydrolyzing) [Planctomycetes bacterium]|nr:UDP-N-acetylglucosamine 2-epimerase (hydrolyzing) [Planctomycetota bacterium]